MQYIHEQNRIHRDLKPSNLMLSSDGLVKILDLGMARIFAGQAATGELTQSNLALGTADYMAPEQWEDSHNVDVRADIYSLGCTLYKLLTGNAPFSGAAFKPPPLKKIAHGHLPHPPVQSHRPDVPAAVAAVLDRMLEKEPQKRYATPREVVAALAPFGKESDCRQLVAVAQERSAATRPDGQIVSVHSGETAGFKDRTPGSPGKVPGGATVRGPYRKRWLAAIAASVVAGCLLLAWTFGGGWTGSREVSDPQQPVGPLGKPDPAPAPVKNRAVLFGEPNDLLEEPPKELLWAKLPTHFLNFMPQSRQLRVGTSAVSLLGLGSTINADYRIKLCITQSPWLGNAGLFFGYHEVMINNKPGVKYQWLEVVPDAPKPDPAKPNAPKVGRFILTRNYATMVKRADGSLNQLPVGFAQAKLDQRPRDDHENVLEIHVKPHRLIGVYWNSHAPYRA